MTVYVTFDGSSSKDKRKSKKHTVTLHWNTKDMVIKSDTIRLIREAGSQLAYIVQATIKDVLQTFGYERQWKVNIIIDGAATMAAARQVDRFLKLEMKRHGGQNNFLKQKMK